MFRTVPKGFFLTINCLHNVTFTGIITEVCVRNLLTIWWSLPCPKRSTVVAVIEILVGKLGLGKAVGFPDTTTFTQKIELELHLDLSVLYKDKAYHTYHRE